MTPEIAGHQWSLAERVDALDEVIRLGRGWLGNQQPRHEGEIPSVNVAKQLAQEACEFATSVSDAVKQGHLTSVCANERLLLDRFLHAARFFEEPLGVVDWAYWSAAEMQQLVGNAKSQGVINPQDQESRELMQSIRRWNRSESGRDRPMSKPGAYKWHQTRRKLTNSANAGIKANYDIASTYVHPTYRGETSSDPEIEYVLDQAVWVTCATLVICGATPERYDGPTAHQVDQHLLELIEVLDRLLVGRADIADVVGNPPKGVNRGQMLYIYASVLVRFTFGRDLIEGQPSLV